MALDAWSGARGDAAGGFDVAAGLAGAVIAMDETPVKQLGGVGTTLKGYLWTGVGDADHPYDCFFYTSDRCSVGPESFLSGYRGYLLSDAYVAYERIGDLWPGVIKASCWAHGRRRFEACHHLGATHQTHTSLAYFRQLIDIEDLYRQSSDEERLAGRREKSKPIVDAFHAWLEEERSRQLPKAKLSGAINYMLNRWDSFTCFLESGMIPLDNNVAERALKFPILGRKAWLFVGHQQAGETAAKLFTLPKTCNRLHIDPFAYLQDVYARLPTTPLDELPSLLPDRWLEEHSQHLIPERVQEALDRGQRARERRAERRAAACARSQSTEQHSSRGQDAKDATLTQERRAAGRSGRLAGRWHDRQTPSLLHAIGRGFWPVHFLGVAGLIREGSIAGNSAG